MFNDPLGDHGGDYYQNPAESGASGVNAVAFHGGYQRISHASGNHWSNALDNNTIEGPFSQFWGDFIGAAFDGQHDASISGGGMAQIFDIWSGLTQGEGFGIGYGQDGSIGVITTRYMASSEASGISYFQVSNARNIPVGLHQFIAMAVGESRDGVNVDEIMGIASTMIMRMKAVGTDLTNPNWKEATSKPYGGNLMAQYKVLRHNDPVKDKNNDYFQIMFKMTINEVMNSSNVGIKAAISAYKNWDIDYSNPHKYRNSGFYYWNASDNLKGSPYSANPSAYIITHKAGKTIFYRPK